MMWKKKKQHEGKKEGALFLPGGVFVFEGQGDHDDSCAFPYRMRIKIFGAVAAVLFFVLFSRLVWISVLGQKHYLREKLFSEKILIQRGEIMDRHGTLLAINLPACAIYVHPFAVQHKKEVLKSLQAVLPMVPQEDIRKALYSTKSFAWIARCVSPSVCKNVQALGISGIGVHKNYKRLYPYDFLFAHIVGMTDVDQKGISGLEKSLEKRLLESQQPVRLSIDTRLQYLIHQSLSQHIKNFDAVGGNVVLVHIATGQILAMVSLPDFSPRAPAKSPSQALFNRNVSGVYEFGSIFKIFNAASFLENNPEGINAVFDATHPLVIGKHAIKDFKGKCRPLSVEEGFIYSSDIVNARMALSVGAEAQTAFFQKMGFHKPVFTELPEYAFPLFSPSTSLLQTAVRSFGYGIAVTPLHVIQALRKILGHTSPLTFLLQDAPSLCRPPSPQDSVNPAISSHILHLLEKAVTDGVVRKAQTSACHVGAKTGTANILVGKKYLKDSGCNFTSCIVVFPVENPQYILLVSLDRAKGNASTYGYATAGWIAAPLASIIVEQSVPLLGIFQTTEDYEEDLSIITDNILKRNNKK